MIFRRIELNRQVSPWPSAYQFCIVCQQFGTNVRQQSVFTVIHLADTARPPELWCAVKESRLLKILRHVVISGVNDRAIFPHHTIVPFFLGSEASRPKINLLDWCPLRGSRNSCIEVRVHNCDLHKSYVKIGASGSIPLHSYLEYNLSIGKSNKIVQ